MQVFGHRGAAGEAPENTIAGARHAISRGTRCVEIDLRLSADKQLVIVHDNSTERTCGIKRQITRTTAKQLAQLDARSFGPPWPRKAQCGIPTLKQYLHSTPELKRYQLEVKSDRSTDKDQVIAQLGTLFPDRVAAKKVVITSFDYELLAMLNERLPYLRFGAISYKTAALSTAKKLGCDYFCCYESIATEKFIRKLRQTDMHLSVWTVNNPESIKRLYALGVDSIITDYPSMAIPLVNSLMR